MTGPRGTPPLVRCDVCGSERNATEPRCLNVACPAHVSARADFAASPLSLRAVEALITNIEECLDRSEDEGYIVEAADALTALLAHCRALRAALRERRMYVDLIIETVEAVDNRAMAADGPVTPTRQEMTDDEMREIYEAAVNARERAAAVLASATDA